MLAVLLLVTLTGPLGQASPSRDTAVPRVVGGEIEEPRKLKSVAPRYPDDARRAGLAGVVVLECTISPKGDVQSITAIRGVRVLSDAATEAVRRWRYTPTLLDGVAVPVIMTVTVNFKMESVVYDDLMRSLRHEDESIRAAAALNLGGLRRSRGPASVETRDAIVALELLEKNDASPMVRTAAADALSVLDDRPLATQPAARPPARAEAPAGGEQPPAPGALAGAAGGPATAPDPLTTFDTPPRVRKQARPQYPRKAFEARIQGTVLVEALIDTKGRIAKARVIESVTGLDEAALDAVRKWRFDPAIRHGKPVSTIIHMPVKFKIE